MSTLGTEALWTPAVVVNSPPNGSATGWANGSFLGSSSGTSVSLSNGSAGVLEVKLNWTIGRLGLVWLLGPGFAQSCPSTYSIVVSGSPHPTTAWCSLRDGPAVSDINLSTSGPVDGCPFLGTNGAASFDDSFRAYCLNGSAYAGHCGASSISLGAVGWAVMRISYTGFAIHVPVPGAESSPWLAVADPVNQAVNYKLVGPGCFIHEAVGNLAGTEVGLLAWGPTEPLARASAPSDSPCQFV